MDFDIQMLRQAVFAGTPRHPEEIGQYLESLGVPVPCSISVASVPAQSQAPQIDSCLILDQLHSGLFYYFSKRSSGVTKELEDHGFICGKHYRCTRREELLRCMQRAVVATRTRELKLHQAQGTAPRGESERNIRDLMLREMRSGDTSLLDTWLSIVVLRYSSRLHAIRRKLLEAVCLLSQHCDRDIFGHLDRAVHRAAGEIQNLYTISDIHKVFPKIIEPIVEALSTGPQAYSSLTTDALDIIQQSAYTGISARDIANELGVTGAHLARQFKSETNETLSDALHRARIEYAQELLAHGDEGILEIALQSGFPSLEHFYRIFKRITGMTPRKWRMQVS